MNNVHLQDQTYTLQEGETVLEGLLRYGVAIPHGCRAGACQSCIMMAEAGTIPAQAQVGLKTGQKQLGYFLSCQCVPQNSLQVRFADQLQQAVSTRVLSLEPLAASVLRLRLAPELDYRPGQYLNIWHTPTDASGPLIRSYSIASVPALDDFIELHIKIIPSGRFSTWAETQLKAGEEIRIQGPLGQCVYSAQHLQQPMLLIGIGTGLAPLYGIARDALNQGHAGSIELVLGAKSAKGFYLQEELALLSEEFPNLRVHYLSHTDADSDRHVLEADLYQYVKTALPTTKGYSVYLCGAASFVRKMKKQCFLAGAAMQEIYADAFLPCS